MKLPPLQTPPTTAACITVVLTTLASFEIGQRSTCHGSSSSSGSAGGGGGGGVDAASPPNNNRCLFMRSCVQYLADYERFIAGGNLSFNDHDFIDACNKHDDIVQCVRRAKPSCVVRPPSGTSGAVGSSSGSRTGSGGSQGTSTNSRSSSPSTAVTDVDSAGIDPVADEVWRTWHGLNTSLSYLCHDVKSVFLRYNKECFTQPHFLSSVKTCNKTFHMEKELYAQNGDDLCRITKSFLNCLREKTTLHCKDATAADIVTTAVRLLRQPRLDARQVVPCALSGARVTWHSLSLVSCVLLSLLITRQRLIAFPAFDTVLYIHV